MRRIKTGFLVLAAAVLLTFSASGAVLADTAPVLQEDLGYGVRYAFSDTHTDSGALKIHTVSFRPSEKKAELKLGLSHQSVSGVQQLLGMAEDGDDRYGGKVVAGINGGFFSMDTSVGHGIPFGFMVQDGELYTSPPVPYQGEPYPPNGCDAYCVAMYEDNTAFIDYAPWMDITLHVGEASYTVNHINRLRMKGSCSVNCPDALVLYTDKFGASTRTDSSGGQEVVIRIQKGAVRGGDVLEGIVQRLSPSGVGDTAIPEGCVVLSSCDVHKEMLEKLRPGQTVYISFTYENERWNRVKFALGGVQFLIRDGRINPNLDGSGAYGGYSSPSPMTAVGVKEDGTVMLVTADGRQPGFSKGLTVWQMAQLLLEQGCYNAMHLDGGGSTTMIAKRGGQLKLMNRPSDGAQRQVANGILVVGYDEKQPGIGGAYHTLPTASVFTTAAASGTGISTRAATEAGEAQEPAQTPPPGTTKAVSESTAEITRSGATATASTDNGATKSAGSAPSLLPIMMIAGCAAVSVGAAGYLLWWKKRRLR